MSPKPNVSQGDLGSILGSLLGGTTSGSGDLVGDLLRTFAGSDGVAGAGLIENSPLGNLLVQPLVDKLVERTGLDRSMARTVVVFAITTLLAAATQKPGAKRPGAKKPRAKGLKVNDLLNPSYLEESGLVNQLSQQSGLDQETAATSLQQVFAALGTQLGQESTPTPRVAPRRKTKKRK